MDPAKLRYQVEMKGIALLTVRPGLESREQVGATRVTGLESWMGLGLRALTGLV